ncbi:hypothetical protein [uncultured Nocardioides sp.]|uniref:hypothetical protein n=1 Tax=uncultured Nocardioides sp. TaxID=198441 RepID=UPI002607CA90|nr:hypothetical protein [uncultured Nocardioides sp.]
MSKLTMLAAFGAGYVLGAKAGRDRYEEILAAAGKVRSNPQVQRATEQVTETVKEQAPVVADKVKETAAQAAGKVQETASQAADTVQEKADEVRSDSSGSSDSPTPNFNAQPPAGPPPAS